MHAVFGRVPSGGINSSPLFKTAISDIEELVDDDADDNDDDDGDGDGDDSDDDDGDDW